MHPNPVFRRATGDRNREFAAERGFGALVAGTPDGLRISHIPFDLDRAGGPVHAHLARPNPLVAVLRQSSVPAVLVVSGPDGYISPDWYGIDDQVPTWNYVAVHLRGTLRLCPADRLPAHLEALSARFETRLAGKSPWTPGKVSPGRMAALLKAIVPVELDIEAVDGTWKLGQNRPDAARLAAAGELAAAGPGLETALLAGLMQDPPTGRSG